MEMGDDTVYEAEKQRSKEAKKQRSKERLTQRSPRPGRGKRRAQSSQRRGWPQRDSSIPAKRTGRKQRAARPDAPEFGAEEEIGPLRSE